MTTRKYDDTMREISGFGGSYEDGCRTMVLAALDWMEAHPTEDPKFHGFKDVTGICIEDNAAAKAMSDAMTAAADAKYPNGGVTGAMHQASVSHAMAAKRLGWDAYVAKMRELKAAEK